MRKVKHCSNKAMGVQSSDKPSHGVRSLMSNYGRRKQREQAHSSDCGH